MRPLHTVHTTETLLSAAIASCPPSARLRPSLKALRAPLSHLKHLTNLDATVWQTTLNELGNFADDVVALLSRYQPHDRESDQRLQELHASAVNHALDLETRGFLTAFHPSHSHAAHIRDLSNLANAPPDSLRQVFHSLPTLLTCVETLITLPVSSSNTIENALKTALKSAATADPFPPPDTIVPCPDYSRYTPLRATVQQYLASLKLSENTNPHARRILNFLRILMQHDVLHDERLQLDSPHKLFQIPSEVGRSTQSTVYKGNTSVYDRDRHLWITNIAIKAYHLHHTTETLSNQFHQEALRLRTLSHPCLPAFYGYSWPSSEHHSTPHASLCDDPPPHRVLLATELMTKNLAQARSTPALRSVTARLRVLRDVADALAYLHRQRIYHGRLNPNNVLLRMSEDTVYGRVKVDVTSLAGRVLSKEPLDQRSVSPLLYLAPESLGTGPEYFTSDVWSLGMLACFLMTDAQRSLNQMCNGVFARMASGQSLHAQVETWCASISEERIKSVVENCLHRDPTKRSDALSVLRALSDILTQLTETGYASRMDYTEEVVDGSVVDEVIDSSAIEVQPAITKHSLKEQPSPFRATSQSDCEERPPRIEPTRTTRDTSGFTSHLSSENEGRGVRQFPDHTAMSSLSRNTSKLRTVTPEVIDSDSENNDAEENPAHQFALAQKLETGCGVDRDMAKAIELYRAAQQKGDIRAAFRLAQCYRTATGVHKDLQTAMYLLEQAADGGHKEAMLEIGRHYETGRSVKEHEKSAYWFQRAAEAGLAEGWGCYAKCLLEGFGVMKDTAQAVALLEKAHKHGNVRATFELALCIRDGTGLAKDDKKACDLYRWAAQRGHAEAQLEYANCLYEGVGTDIDRNHAFKMYKLSADQGQMDAYRHLGECYEVGHGIKKDVNKAVQCFKKASNAGNASAMSSLAGCYERGEGVDHDIKKAIQLYKKAEKKNDYLALNNLGVMFERGVHVKRDYEKAVKYYRKAKAQGFTEATCNLADCYAGGNGVRRDMDKAIHLYREAAGEGHPGAKCELGKLYYRGLGLPKDYNRAVGLFREACDAESEAKRLLGIAYFAGHGVDRNVDKAVGLFRKAAEEGNSEANLNLGLCSMKGCGVSKCLSGAMSLLTLAAEGGSKEAKLILGNMYYEGRGVQQDIRRAVELFLEGEDVDLTWI